ncbi:hypothetical protein FIBSPDRAFT_1055314 [Athelia psychrophila]|uniref:Uncharacterized protein n=1 Tax=Athelia psychrophila TaxID=1759441 RepID=A0A167TXV8_9AGAM|nr:hypothetical protein FIBSPDRAFT_1055314 [Fibularhizoctonia sp. CBS 109695]
MSDPFAHFYQGAREIKAAERSGKPEDLKKLDFSLAPQVMHEMQEALHQHVYRTIYANALQYDSSHMAR